MQLPAHLELAPPAGHDCAAPSSLSAQHAHPFGTSCKSSPAETGLSDAAQTHCRDGWVAINQSCTAAWDIERCSSPQVRRRVERSVFKTQRRSVGVLSAPLRAAPADFAPLAPPPAARASSDALRSRRARRGSVTPPFGRRTHRKVLRHAACLPSTTPWPAPSRLHRQGTGW